DGPPAAWIASLSRWTHQLQVCAADGWTLNTTALPAATMPIALHRMVSVGLVVGVTASSTPYGARSVSIRPSSPVYATGRRISTPGVFSATSRFLASLSSSRPRPAAAGVRDGAQDLDARRLVGAQPVLGELVLVAAEAGLLDRVARQRVVVG